MEPSERQFVKKERSGLRKIWDYFKDVFRDNLTTTTTTVTATTPTITSPLKSRPSAPSLPNLTHPASNEPAAVPVSNLHQPAGPPPVLEVDDVLEKSPVSVDISIEPSEKITIVEQDPHHMSKMRFSQAQAILAKYNIEFSETSWDTASKAPYERVHKNIRMRVRYTCHNCATTFGHDRVCIGCQHRRCGQCSRYPPKRDRTKHSQTTTAAPSPPRTGTEAQAPDMESGVCHECQSSFDGDDGACPNCRHRICERCVRESLITVEHSPERIPEPGMAEEGVSGLI